VSAIAASIDGKKCFSGSRDYSVKVWDTETQQCLQEYKVPRNIVTSLDVDQMGGPLLYQGSEDLCVRVWDTREAAKQPCGHITGFVYFPLCASLSEDATMLATGCKGFDSVGCEVKVWDLRAQSKILHEFKGHSQDVTDCKFKGNDTLASVSKDGSIYSWDVKSAPPSSPSPSSSIKSTGKMFTSLAFLNFEQGSQPRHANYSNEEKTLIACGAFDGSLNFYSGEENGFEEQSEQSFSAFFTDGQA